jgi:hypothetical protein
LLLKHGRPSCATESGFIDDTDRVLVDAERVPVDSDLEFARRGPRRGKRGPTSRYSRPEMAGNEVRQHAGHRTGSMRGLPSRTSA